MRVQMMIGILALCGIASAGAQQFPSKSIRWISPHAAGGGTDLTTRLVAQKMSEVIGQSIVVDNRIGASGNIGGEIAARAPADGYTVMTMTASHPANHAMTDSVSYDLTRDFAYVTQMTTQPYILVAHPSLKVSSVKELAAAAATQPRTLHYGTAGVGTLQHFAGTMFAAMTKTEVVHVPYKGGAPATADFLGGRLQFFFGVPVSTLQHIKAGRMRALAVTSVKRAAVLPELPSVAETGLAGYAVDNWYGIAAPAKTPRAIVMRLHAAAVRALTGHMRFVFHGVEDLQPLIKNANEAELQSLIKRLPRRTEADSWDEVMRVTNNQSDEELLQMHVTASRHTVHWLAENGQDWVPSIGAQALGDNIVMMNGGGDSMDRYVYPYSIMVNVNGERFADEGEDTRGRTYAKMGRAILAQPGGVAFQILDAKARKLNLYPTNYAKATGAKANTLEILAEALDINAQNFVKTVREFNGAIQPGTFDPDRYKLDGKCTAGITPRKSNYTLSIDAPPFEGWAVRCGMTFTFGGMKVDAKTAQMQHVAGRAIPGLYAAGEMVGGLWVGNYASGSGMMAGATYGRIAGTHAALVALAALA